MNPSAEEDILVVLLVIMLIVCILWPLVALDWFIRSTGRICTRMFPWSRQCARSHQPLHALPTPTHADPRGLAKQLFRSALRDFGMSEVFLEWIRVDPPVDDESHVLLIAPTGTILAFGVFTGDERDGWIQVVYYPDKQGKPRWPTPQPHPTKESYR